MTEPAPRDLNEVCFNAWIAAHSLRKLAQTVDDWERIDQLMTEADELEAGPEWLPLF